MCNIITYGSVKVLKQRGNFVYPTVSNRFMKLDWSAEISFVGLNIFYSEEKDWARHTTRQCPLQKYHLLTRFVDIRA